jgi:hypothetical protein
MPRITSHPRKRATDKEKTNMSPVMPIMATLFNMV